MPNVRHSLLKKETSCRVTQDHIDKAIPCDPDHCVIAMSASEKLGFPARVINGRVTGKDPETGFTYQWVLSASAALVPMAIDTLDPALKEMIKPFSYKLKNPIILRKPVLVRKHGRALPGTIHPGAEASRIQRSMGAHLRKALSERRHAPGSRFQGV